LPAPAAVGAVADEDYGEGDVYVVVVVVVEAAGKLEGHNLAENGQRLGIAELGNQTHIVRLHRG